MADTDIKFRVSQTGAESVADSFKNVEDSFDGLDITAEDLHARLSDLDSQMRTLISTQGKMAYESRQGTRIQRERGFALERLLAMQDKEIEATNRSSRGMSTLAGSLGQSVLGMKGMTSEIGLLITSLMSGAGLTVALAGAAGLFKLVTGEAKKAKDEINEIQKSISNLIKITEKKGAFEVAPENIGAAIELLRSQIRKPGFLTQSMTVEEIAAQQELNAEIFKQNSILLNSIKILEDEQKAHKEKIDVIERLRAAGLTYTEQTDKETKAIEKKTKAIKEWRAGVSNIALGNFGTQGMRDPAQFQFRTDLLGGFDFSREELLNMQQNAEEMKRQTEEHFNMIQDLSLISANILREEFTEAWRSIFGEANSLFEKFAMRISEYFVNLALQKAAFGLFNLIFPGAGTAGDLVFGKSSPGGTATYNLILDGEKVGEFVDRRVPYSVNRAVRLNVL